MSEEKIEFASTELFKFMVVATEIIKNEVVATEISVDAMTGLHFKSPKNQIEIKIVI